jgi:hypothetical protein
MMKIRQLSITAQVAALTRRIVIPRAESIFAQYFATTPNRSEARACQTIGGLRPEIMERSARFGVSGFVRSHVSAQGFQL